ncbi:MAG: hypothetical protein WA633_07220 [Stellaceae bacterium]
MWKAPASFLWGCLGLLPLIGCAQYAAPPQAVAPSPAVVAGTASDDAVAPRVYTGGPAAPAAVLVFLPGNDFLVRDPALWAAQGFDVVMPQPADLYQLVADQQAALARLVASAHALADAPVWLVGPGPAIETALESAPQLGRGGVSGAVVTSVSSNTSGCSESFFYSDPGTGAPPKVEVRRSGNSGPGSPAITGRQPPILPAPSAPRPNQPRIIEASAVGKNLAAAATVRNLAELIKSAPSG